MSPSLSWKAFTLLVFIIIGVRFYFLIHEEPSNTPSTALNVDSSGQLFNELYKAGQINISSDGIIHLPSMDKALAVQQTSPLLIN